MFYIGLTSFYRPARVLICNNIVSIPINLNLDLNSKIIIPELINSKMIQVTTGATNTEFTETRIIINPPAGIVYVSSVDPLGSVTYSINFKTGEIKVSHIYGEGTHNNRFYYIQKIL